DVGAEKLRHIVFHYFACAFGLSTVKRKAELIQPLAGQITSARSRPFLKRSKERTGDPPAAVVRSEFVIFDDDHPHVRRLDPHLAWRHENAEVGNRSLRPIEKPFGNRTFVLGFDGVELTVFGRTTRA